MSTKLFNFRIDENLLDKFNVYCSDNDTNKTAILTQLIEMVINGDIDLGKDIVKTSCKDNYNIDETRLNEIIDDKINDRLSKIVNDYDERFRDINCRLSEVCNLNLNIIKDDLIDNVDTNNDDIGSTDKNSFYGVSDYSNLVTCKDNSKDNSENNENLVTTPTPDHDIVQNQQQQQNLLTANDLIGLGVEVNKNTLNTWLRRGKIPENQSLSKIYSITSHNGKNYFVNKTC